MSYKLINERFREALRLLSVCLMLTTTGYISAQENPFVDHIYTADPSAHVWEDGRLYVYASQDIFPAHGCDRMDKYHVFSTDDMITWVDHGEILAAKDVPWGRPSGGFMWAPDCAYKNGTYYFYFPHPTGEDDWNETWKIGVATSKEPAANFEVQGYIEGLKPMIDPCVFVDDDGQAYLYYGGGNICEGGKLKDNMMEVDGEMQRMTGLNDFHEGAWVHKYNGYYYLSYADNSSGGNKMRYAMSKNPLGPWVYRGVYIDSTGSSTNHGSIVEYKGNWFAFYHNSYLSRGHDWLRSICVDRLYYNEDGTIQMVEQTSSWDASGLFTAMDNALADDLVKAFYADGAIHLDTPDKFSEVALYDLSGKSLLVTEANSIMNISLTNGVYLLHIKNEKEQFTRKIMVR